MAARIYGCLLLKSIMNSQALKKGIICWVSTVTGKTGHGKPLSLEDANRLARQANAKDPLIIHTVKEVQ